MTSTARAADRVGELAHDPAARVVDETQAIDPAHRSSVGASRHTERVPSKKQRRRQQKLKRHEWEEVYVDQDGRELDPDEAEQLIEPTKATRGAKAQPVERGRRVVEPPSWRRTLKRGLLFFPLMLIVVFVIPNASTSTVGKVIQTLTLMAFFLPFSYFMDSVVWRSYRRRQAKSESPRKS